ncbi:copper resistance D family protein [Shouchella patagoniensis]|uniref:copper resistance D family protein n=1 Tax=Shouchella patagoniensis TaxID=228576 RepID=UPI0009958013|nr:copper resistance D family protein [Shouchella patagoniensis]
MIEPVLNGLLYTLLALLAGVFVIQLVPKERGVSKQPAPLTVMLLILGVPLIFSGYLLRLAVTYASFFSISYADAVLTVMNEHIIGVSFLVIIGTSITMTLIYLLMEKKQKALAAGINIVLVLVLIAAVSFSSHSASITGIQGIVSNGIHLFAMSFWIGPLFMVSLYGSSLKDPQKFHQWFSSLAGFCLLLLITSGFIMMGEIAPEYVNSWMLTYGQLLLIKHILFIPLLIFGFRHLLSLSGKGAKLSTEEQQRSFRIEAIIALLVFSVTAGLTETEPPHNVLRTLQSEPMSPIMDIFLNEALLENQLIAFSPSIGAIFLLVAAGIFLLVALFCGWWFRKTWYTAASTVLFVGTAYLGVMASSSPGEIPVNLTIHDSVEEAIAVGNEDDEIELIETVELDDHSIGAIYSVNEQHLTAERLLVEKDGYRKYLDAEVELENGFLTGGERFMDTFMFIENDWIDEEKVSTYVSLGYVTEDISEVEIVFSDTVEVVPVSNQVFLHVLSVNQAFEEAHRFILYNEAGERVHEVEKRQFIHEGHVH